MKKILLPLPAFARAIAFTGGCLIFFLSVQSVQAAYFYFDPLSKSINTTTEFTVDLKLNTKGEATTGVDVLINYDKNILEVKEVSFNSLYPLNDKQIDNGSGVLKIFSTFSSAGYSFNGNDRLATIKLGSKNSGSGNLNIACTAGSTTDSNIWKQGGGDIIDCSQNQNGNYTVNSASPSPSPSPSPHCGVPAVPTNVKAVSGPGAGQITLSWTKSDGGPYYNIAYGPSSLNYLWGNPNIGDVDRLVVGSLIPGKPYYFIVAAVNGCGSSGALHEVAAYAGQAGASSGSSPQQYWKAPDIVQYTEPEASASAVASPSTASPSASASPKSTGLGFKFPSLSSLLGLPTWLKIIGIAGLVLIILSLIGRKLAGDEGDIPPMHPETESPPPIETYPSHGDPISKPPEPFVSQPERPSTEIYVKPGTTMEEDREKPV